MRKELTIGKLIVKLQKVFNAYIRQRDAGQACISCGSYNELQAGHYWSAGHYSWLRFNEMNVNHQCKRCNYFLSGNQAQYRIGLVRKYGEKAVDQLDLKAQIRTVTRWSRFELEALIKHYQQRLNELKRAA
jgi:hypothetical protein